MMKMEEKLNQNVFGRINKQMKIEKSEWREHYMTFDFVEICRCQNTFWLLRFDSKMI